jgi:hypothetical protein
VPKCSISSAVCSQWLAIWSIMSLCSSLLARAAQRKHCAAKSRYFFGEPRGRRIEPAPCPIIPGFGWFGETTRATRTLQSVIDLNVDAENVRCRVRDKPPRVKPSTPSAAALQDELERALVAETTAAARSARLQPILKVEAEVIGLTPSRMGLSLNQGCWSHRRFRALPFLRAALRARLARG